MKYCIFKNNKYTGVAYNELTSDVKTFEKNAGRLVVAMEAAPEFKTDKDGKVIETLTLTQEEADAYAKDYAIEDLKSQLRDNKYVDAQMKCFSDGLVFKDKYPELAAERDAIIAELN